LDGLEVLKTAVLRPSLDLKDLKILILDEENLIRKPVISIFFGYRHNTGMTGQNRHYWPDFFKGTFF